MEEPGSMASRPVSARGISTGGLRALCCAEFEGRFRATRLSVCLERAVAIAQSIERRHFRTDAGSAWDLCAGEVTHCRAGKAGASRRSLRRLRPVRESVNLHISVSPAESRDLSAVGFLLLCLLLFPRTVESHARIGGLRCMTGLKLVRFQRRLAVVLCLLLFLARRDHVSAFLAVGSAKTILLSGKYVFCRQRWVRLSRTGQAG